MFNCQYTTLKTCTGCGSWCCHFRKPAILSKEENDHIQQEIYTKTGVFYLYPFSRYTINLTKEEKEKLESLAKQKGLTFTIIPKKIIYDQEKDTFHILDYSPDHDICPFLEGENCTIYHDRPLICQLFPYIESNDTKNIKEFNETNNIKPPTHSLSEVRTLFLKRYPVNAKTIE